MTPTRRSNRRAARRRGSVLPWVAVLLFVFLALAALVVDGSLATATRRQLQAAANSAALEGLRLRDDAGPFDTEDKRRQQVALLVRQSFDDNLDPTDGDLLHFAAGADWRYEEGVVLEGTTYRARPRLALGEQDRFDWTVGDPRLRANLANHAAGDMVRGTYVGGPRHIDERAGDEPYHRDDFTPDAADAAAPGDAFLVRIRRTGEALSAVGEGDSASAGPPLPYLFGRTPAGGPAWLDQRERGMPVRGTAIAQARPALVVGRSYRADSLAAGQPRLPGAAPWAIALESWNGADVDNEVADPAAVRIAPAMTRIGQSVLLHAAPVDPADAPAAAEFDYAPLYAEIGDESRIVGFGCVRWSLDPDTGEPMFVKLPGRVAPRNARAQPPGGLPGELTPADVALLFSQLAAIDEPLLAPALVRAIQ